MKRLRRSFVVTVLTIGCSSREADGPTEGPEHADVTCPASKPTVGARCEGSFGCEYGSCSATAPVPRFQCELGKWRDVSYSCNPPTWGYDSAPLDTGPADTAPPPPVPTPKFDPPAGTYSTPQMVIITTAMPGVTVCYTTDKTTPSCDAMANCVGSMRETARIPVGVGTTSLRAIGCAVGAPSSEVASATYVVGG